MEQPTDSSAAPDPGFALVPLRFRRDGWTSERQRLFIRVLRETGSVSRACRAAGRTRASVYRLYARSDAAGFRRAWHAAAALAGAARIARRAPPRRPASLHPCVPDAAGPMLAQGREIRVRGCSDSGSWMVSTSSTLSPSGKLVDALPGGSLAGDR